MHVFGSWYSRSVHGSCRTAAGTATKIRTPNIARFTRVWCPARLIEYAGATGDGDSCAAATRAVEFFLRQRLFRSERTSAVIEPAWLQLHYPVLALRYPAGAHGASPSRAADRRAAARTPGYAESETAAGDQCQGYVPSLAVSSRSIVTVTRAGSSIKRWMRKPSLAQICRIAWLSARIRPVT
jgi:hypothetical protein